MTEWFQFHIGNTALEHMPNVYECNPTPHYFGGSPNNVSSNTMLTHSEFPKAINTCSGNTRKSLLYYLLECGDIVWYQMWCRIPCCSDEFELIWYYQPTFSSFIPVFPMWPSYQKAHWETELYSRILDRALWQNTFSFHYYLDSRNQHSLAPMPVFNAMSKCLADV